MLNKTDSSTCSFSGSIKFRSNRLDKDCGSRPFSEGQSRKHFEGHLISFILIITLFLYSTILRVVTSPCFMLIQHLTQNNPYLDWCVITFNRSCYSPTRPNFFNSLNVISRTLKTQQQHSASAGSDGAS